MRRMGKISVGLQEFRGELLRERGNGSNWSRGAAMQEMRGGVQSEGKEVREMLGGGMQGLHRR